MEVRLLVLHHKAVVQGGTRFLGFIEYRLVDAVRR